MAFLLEKGIPVSNVSAGTFSLDKILRPLQVLRSSYKSGLRPFIYRLKLISLKHLMVAGSYSLTDWESWCPRHAVGWLVSLSLSSSHQAVYSLFLLHFPLFSSRPGFSAAGLSDLDFSGYSYP